MSITRPQADGVANDRKWLMISCLTMLSICISLTAPTINHAVASNPDLTDLSLEDLMDIEITSVSKRTQKLSEAAAAVFVITAEDIRRSGVTNIPDALRMVPGIQVARIDANKWAVSARGFNSRWSNKLLVLIDGRTIYDPIFSGVFWDAQDVVLEDIDRIEVIRGPGATLWGASAVNGVINITTKGCDETLGGLATAGAGTEEKWFAHARYGAALNDAVTARLYAKYFSRGGSVAPGNKDAADDWDMLRAGFRADWSPSPQLDLSFQGELYDGTMGSSVLLVDEATDTAMAQSGTGGFDDSGGHILADIARDDPSGSQMRFKLYFFEDQREESAGRRTLQTFDLDFSHRLPLGAAHELIWGLGYRHNKDHFKTTSTLEFNPTKRSDHLISGFVQGEISLLEDVLDLIIGSKFEENNYSGFEYQPNLRFVATPASQHKFWTSVSRAVRTPSRWEEDLDARVTVIPANISSVDSDQPIQLRISGSRDVDSEELTAVEVGYRYIPTECFSLDIAGFYNRYEALHTTEVESIALDGETPSIAIDRANNAKAETYGIESVIGCRCQDNWQIQLAHSYLRAESDTSADSSDIFVEDEATFNIPEHQFSIRTSWNPTENLEVDLWIRYVDALRDGEIPAYTTVDVRLGWQINDRLELSLVGQNLTDAKHLEFFESLVQSEAREIERSVYAQVKWRF